MNGQHCEYESQLNAGSRAPKTSGEPLCCFGIGRGKYIPAWTTNPRHWPVNIAPSLPLGPSCMMLFHNVSFLIPNANSLLRTVVWIDLLLCSWSETPLPSSCADIWRVEMIGLFWWVLWNDFWLWHTKRMEYYSVEIFGLYAPHIIFFWIFVPLYKMDAAHVCL